VEGQRVHQRAASRSFVGKQEGTLCQIDGVTRKNVAALPTLRKVYLV
jgi:hypothetical protein